MSPGVPSLGGPTGPRERPPGVEADLGNNGNPLETTPPPGQPWLAFAVSGVRAVEHAAAPTLIFTLDVDDRSGQEVFAVALTMHIHIEPIKRSYDEETRAKLIELFGEPRRWAKTAGRMLWSIESVLVHNFKGSTSVEVPVLCNYDLELAATKYFSSVPDGEVPVAFHFNGSVYYSDTDDRLQIVQLPWDTVADYQMPVATWKQMIDLYYPYRGWVPLHSETMERLERFKAERGRHTFDETIAELLRESEA